MLIQRVLCRLVVLFTLLWPAPVFAQASVSVFEEGLRDLLAQRPDNDLAREQLTLLLLRSGRAEAAAYHAEILSQRAVDPKLRKDAEALREKIDGPEWGWRPILSFTPSSNLNKASTEDVIYIGDVPFNIDDDSRAKSGIGLTFGLAGWRAWRVGEATRLRWSSEASATVYDTDELETQSTLRSSLTFSRRFDRFNLSYGASIDGTLEDGDLTRRRVGPFAAFSWPLGERDIASVRLEIQDVTYLEDAFRSGPTNKLTLGWSRDISPDLGLQLSVPLKTLRTERDHLDYDSFGVSFTLTKHWRAQRLKTSLGLGWREDHYAGTFPGTSVKRRDDVGSISLSARYAGWDVGGFVPSVRYDFSRSVSNISLYDYSSNDIQVTFQKAF